MITLGETIPGMVSIITPVYNAEKFLSKTCESVLAQTWGLWELVLVDDASTDLSSSVMKSYEERDDRVRCIFMEKNSGPAKARNRGIEAARGEFIAFIDSDDVWAPEKLALQVAVFTDRPSLGMVCTNGYVIDNEDNRTGLMIRPEKIRRGKISPADFVLEGVPVATSSVMVRRQCLIRCGLFKEIYRIGEDFELWMRILKYYELEFIDEKLLYYRKHETNMSSSIYQSKLDKISIFENEILPNIEIYGEFADAVRLKLQKMYTTYGKMLLKIGNINGAMSYLNKAVMLKKEFLVTLRAIIYREACRICRIFNKN